MKTIRLFAALLVVALLPAPVFPQNSGEIATLLTQARRGNGIAQYNLGLIYAEGKGVTADPIEAYVWLSLARENGARGRALDNLSGTLDKAALEVAQRLLTTRKAELASLRPAPIPARPRPATPAPKEPAPAPAPVVVAETPAPPAADTPVDPAEFAALRAERERLAALAAQHEKAARDAEAKVIDLTRTADATRGEMTRVRMALTAAQKAANTPAKPAAPAYPDLSGRVAELEAAYTAASTSLAQAQAALAARSAAPAAPSYPDLSGKVAELESQLNALSSEAARAKQEMAALTKAKDEANAALRAKPAAPVYPDLSGKVAELQAALDAKPATPAYPNLSGKVTELETALTQANAALRAKPAAAEPAALAQKTRELQSALAELEEARIFGRKVEDTLNKVNDDKARVAATAAAELAEARAFGTQVENTLNKVADEKAALESSLRAAEAARDSYAAEFATAKAQLAAAQSATPAAPSAPAYPDLRSNVSELETRVAALTAETNRARQDTAALASASEAALRTASRELDTTKVALALANDALKARPAAPAYPDLSGKVAELETALANSTRQVAAASSEADRAKREVAQLTKTIAETPKAAPAPTYPDYTNHVKELTAEVTKLRADHAQLQQSLTAAERQAGELSAEAARTKLELAALAKARDDRPVAPAYPDLSGRVTELEKELTSARAQVGEQTAAAQGSAPRIRELEARLAALTAEAALRQRETTTLTEARNEAEKSRDAIARQFDEFKSSSSTALRENSSLQASVKLLESDKVSLRRQAETAGNEAAQLRTQVASLKEQVAAKPALPAFPDLRDRVAQLERDLVAKPAAPAYPDLSAKVADLEAALIQTKSVPGYPDLRGKVGELETQLANLSSAMSVVVSGKAESDAQVASLTQANEQARARTAELQTALAAKPAAPTYPDLSGRVGELETALAAARNAKPAYPDLSGKVTDLETQVAQLKGSVSTGSAAMQELEKQLDAAKNAKPAYPDLSGRVKELETQLAHLSSEASRAKQEVAALTKAQEEVKAAPAAPDLSGKVAQLETELADSVRRLVAADNAQADLRKELAATENASKVKSDYVTELEGKLRRQTAAGNADPQLRREHQELTGRVTTLSGEVTQLREDRERHQKLIADSGRRQAADAARIKELETQATASQAALAAAKTEAPAYPDLRGSVTDLKGQLTALSAEAEHTRQQLAASAKSREDAQTQITSLQAQLAAKPAAPAYPDLTGRVAELETAYTAASTSLAQAQAALAARPAAPTYPDLSGKVAELEKQVARQASDLTAAATAKAAAEQQVATLTKAASQPRTEPITAGSPTFPNLSLRVRELETQLAAATADAQARGQQVADLTKTNEAAQRNLDAAKTALARTTAPTTPAYPDLRPRVTELETRLAATERSLAARPAAPAYPDLSNRVAQLERDLSAARNATPAYPDLSSRVAELESRQTRLTADLSAATAAKTAAEQQAATLAARPAAPAFPDLRARVTQLEGELASARNARPAAPAYPDLSRRVAELEATLAARPAAPAFPDLRDRVAQLESDLTAARNARPAAPAYPDLRNVVNDLRGQLTALSAEDARTKQQLAALTRTREEARPPAYPDLRSRVAQLEEQLAAAASQPAAAPAPDVSDLQTRLAETEGRLTTALRGYALLEQDRDALQTRAGQAAEALANEKNTLAAQVATLTAQVEQLQSATASQATAERTAAALTTERDALAVRVAEIESRAAAAQAETARLSESLAALQRSTGQTAGDAATARALVQQLQGANTVLAQENYQLKTALSRQTGPTTPTAPRVLPPVPAARMHVVVSGDSLSKLSQRYYGTAGRWQEIYNANTGILGPNGILRIGTELRIP